MPTLAPDITYYPTAACEEDWYEDGISKDKHPFQCPKESRPPHERDEDRVNEFAAIAEYLSIYNAIERSRYIGRLEDDWNDEGAKGYSPLTWRRTAYFAAVQANSARDAGVSIGIPTIAPADHGSIDIHWQNNDRDLLINVPADPNKRATYYGASRAGETTSGLLDARSARPDLLLWLNGGK